MTDERDDEREHNVLYVLCGFTHVSKNRGIMTGWLGGRGVWIWAVCANYGSQR